MSERLEGQYATGKWLPGHPRVQGARCGDYEVRLNTGADVAEDGGTTAWEVWHWPSQTVESDWFTASDAYKEAARLADNSGAAS